MKTILSLVRLAYGQCTHPMIEKRGAHWYCTECGQMRA